MARALHKALNAFRRWRAGLPPRGGVSPEVRNDLYQALLAVYVFAARFAGVHDQLPVAGTDCAGLGRCVQ